jgi:serine/threonine protein kinase
MVVTEGAGGRLEETLPAEASTDPVEGHTPTDSLASGEDPTLASSSPPPAPGAGSARSGDKVGRYEIKRRLGAGGMGIVCVALDPQLDREVALKLVQPSLGGSGSGGQAAQRLLREARATARVRHPNVVYVFDSGTFEDQVYIVMELVDGITFGRWLREEERPWTEVLSVLIGAAQGLAAAHEAGLVHRDFKPDNILVEKTGTARVLDFGLARSGKETATIAESVVAQADTVAHFVPTDITRTGAIVGTPAYMAPEQHLGDKVDARADQFAFCIVAWEAFFRQRPFGGKTVFEIATNVIRGNLRDPEDRPRDLPPELEQILRKGLSTKPADRYVDTQAALDAIRGVAQTDQRRPSWIRNLGLALVVAGIGTVGGFQLLGDRSPEPALSEEAEPDPVSEIISNSNLPEVSLDALPDDPWSTTLHRLENGLTVYVSPDPTTQKVNALVVVRAGSVHEEDGGSGAAALLATVLENGSARLGTKDGKAEAAYLAEIRELSAAYASAETSERRNEIKGQIRAAQRGALEFALIDEYERLTDELGISAFSYASGAQTLFTNSLGSSRLEAWAMLESERIVRPSFRLFEEARQEMISDRTRALESDWKYNDAKRDELIYGEHPLGRGNQARPADLVALTVVDLEAFHSRWYVPNNTAILLSGNVTPDTAIPLIERHFGDWEAKDFPPHQNPPLKISSNRVEYTAGTANQVSFVWPAFAQGTDDQLALDAIKEVFGTVLHDHRDGLFAQPSPDGGDVLLSAGASSIAWSEGGVLVVSASANSEHDVSEVERLLHRVVDDAREGRLGRFDFEATKRTQAMMDDWSVALGPDGNHARNWILSEGFTRGEPLSLRRGNAKRTEAVALTQAQGVLKRVLSADPLVLVGRRGPVEREVISADSVPDPPRGDTEWSSFADEVLAIPAAPSMPELLFEGDQFERLDAPDGTVFTTRLPDPKFFTVTIRYEAPEGPAATGHRCLAIEALNASQTPELGRALAQHGVVPWWWSVSCRDGYVTMSLDGLDAEFEETVALIDDHLAGSQLGREDLQAAKAEIMRHRVPRVRSLRPALASYVRNLSDSSYMTELAPRRTIEGATVAQIQTSLADLANTRRTIFYAGGRRPDAVAELLRRNGEPPTAEVKSTARYTRSDTPEVFVLDTQSPKAHVYVFFPIQPVPENQTGSAKLLDSYLNAEWDGFSFEYDPEGSARVEAGGVVTLAPLDDARIERAFEVEYDQLVARLDQELESLLAPVDPPRLEEARRSYDEAFRAQRFELWELRQTLFGWARDGLAADPRQAWAVAVKKASLQEVDALVEQARSTSPRIGILGSVQDMDVAALKRRFGTVTRLTASEVMRE